MLTIQELESQTGIPRRTIHFYVKEGLIPPPKGSRRSALYGEEHLLRLRLIQILKEGSHLRLEGIREILDGMRVGEMRDQLEALESALIDPLDLVAHMPRSSPSPDDMSMAHGSPDEQLTRLAAERPAFMAWYDVDAEEREEEEEEDDTVGERGAKPLSRSMGIGGRLKRLVGGGGRPRESESWRRVRVADDVEIHYRETDRKRASKIEKLIALAGEILKDRKGRSR